MGPHLVSARNGALKERLRLEPLRNWVGPRARLPKPQPQVMIASFLVVGGVLAAEYGSIPEIGPADCSFLESVSKNATDAYSVPAPCVGPNCVAAGCIAAVKPEFYQFPSRSTLCDIIFFLINMLAVPHLNWLAYY